jgi:hydroxymethylpyrimidine pyrophosphatase-like HAD family hydrolase
MIELFLADIDGCLSAPYEPYDLDGFRTLADYGRRAETDSTLPRLGICSGRSYAYVEAVAQALGLRGPALFESGGGRFDLATATIRWSPLLTDDVERALNEVRGYFHRDVLPGSGFSFDYGKRAQVGLVGTDQAAIARVAPLVDRFVADSFPDLIVHPTPVSIDVLPRALTKRVAVETVAQEEGLTVADLAFIGDTQGDIEALEVVGHSFAPQNADDAVKAAVQTVTEGAVLDGVLEAYRQCIAHNESALAAA